MRLPIRLAPLLLALVVVSCGGPGMAVPSLQASPPTSSGPQLGPGGLTLDEEVGSVIMAGFEGPLTPALLADWKQRQFGGLLVVNLNHNASSAESMTSLISTVRGVA